MNKFSSNQGTAIHHVWRAIKAGILPKLNGDITCVDCKKTPATHYDHRYYSKPLEVAPVCSTCNMKRGHALDKPCKSGQCPTCKWIKSGFLGIWNKDK